MALAQHSFSHTNPPPPVVTIIDDDPLGQKEIALRVERAGWQPRIVEHSYGADLAGLLHEAESQTNIVICDQKLNHSNYLSSSGISVAKRLLERRIPTLLISQSLSEISRFSDIVPVLGRDELAQAGRLKTTFQESRRNAYDNPNNLDRLYRSIVRVVDTDQVSGKVRFSVSGWDIDELVEIDQRFIPESLHSFLTKGTRLLARARLHSASANDMVLRDFELAPKPDPNDGLA